SINDGEAKAIEEERRLVYVGMTRARKTLTLTRAVYRRVFGNEQQMRASMPSRFLAEIPSDLVDTARGSMAEIGQSRRYEPDPEAPCPPRGILARGPRGHCPRGAPASGPPPAQRACLRPLRKAPRRLRPADRSEGAPSRIRRRHHHRR